MRHEDETATVAMSRDQMKSAPDYDASDWNDQTRSHTRGLLRPELGVGLVMKAGDHA